MIRINQSSWVWVGLAAGLGVLASIAGTQETKKQPADEVKALIDRLTEIDRQDTGYSGSASGAAFLPLGQSESHAMLLFQQRHESSDALKSLVKLGTKALPKLLEHLSDKRLTKIKLSHAGFFGGMFITQDEDPAQKEKEDLAREVVPILTSLTLQSLEKLGYVLIEDDTERTLVFVRPGDLVQVEVILDRDQRISEGKAILLLGEFLPKSS